MVEIGLYSATCQVAGNGHYVPMPKLAGLLLMLNTRGSEFDCVDLFFAAALFMISVWPRRSAAMPLERLVFTSSAYLNSFVSGNCEVAVSYLRVHLVLVHMCMGCGFLCSH